MPAGASQNLLLGDETVSRLRGERRLDSRDYPTLGRPGDARGGGGGDPASSYAGDDRDYSRHHSRWDEDERGGGGRTDPDRSGRRDHRAPVADRDGWGRERGSYGHHDRRTPRRGCEWPCRPPRRPPGNAPPPPPDDEQQQHEQQSTSSSSSTSSTSSSRGAPPVSPLSPRRGSARARLPGALPVALPVLPRGGR